MTSGWLEVVGYFIEDGRHPPTDNCWCPYILKEQINSEFTGLSLSTASLVYIHLLSAYILLSVIFSHLGNLEQHSSWLNTTCRHLINIKPPQTWGLRLHSWSGCGQLQGWRTRMGRVRTCKHYLFRFLLFSNIKPGDVIIESSKWQYCQALAPNP